METEEHKKKLLVTANLSSAEREMDALCEAGEAGMRNGEFLHKKVTLQRRIQQLRDEEQTLKQQDLLRAMIKSREEKLASAAQQAKSYTRFVGEKLPRKTRVGEKKRFTRVTKPVSEKSTVDGGIRGNLADVDSKNRLGQSTSSADVLTGTAGRLCLFSGGSMNRGCTSVSDDKEDTKGTDNNGHQSNDICATSNRKLCSDPADGEVLDGPESSWITGPNFLQTVQLSRERGMDGELQVEAMRRARQAKMQATENRQLRSMQRLNLVEDMFAKAVERRMRAMRRIAADPPADRLIGNSAVQHIPLSMVPGQLQRTTLAFMDGMLQGTKGPCGASTSLLENGVPVKKFFLTDVDTVIEGKPANEEGVSPGIGAGSQRLEDDKTHSNANSIEEELLREWRKLGYTAVYLPATRRLVYPNEENVGVRTSQRRPFDPDAWKQLQLKPLPPIHLVQRQLPPMSILLHDESKLVGRRRQLPSLHHHYFGKK